MENVTERKGESENEGEDVGETVSEGEDCRRKRRNRKGTSTGLRRREYETNPADEGTYTLIAR